MQVYLKLGIHSDGQKPASPLFERTSPTYACSWRYEAFIFSMIRHEVVVEELQLARLEAVDARFADSVFFGRLPVLYEDKFSVHREIAVDIADYHGVEVEKEHAALEPDILSEQGEFAPAALLVRGEIHLREGAGVDFRKQPFCVVGKADEFERRVVLRATMLNSLLTYSGPYLSPHFMQTTVYIYAAVKKDGFDK